MGPGQEEVLWLPRDAVSPPAYLLIILLRSLVLYLALSPPTQALGV